MPWFAAFLVAATAAGGMWCSGGAVLRWRRRGHPRALRIAYAAAVLLAVVGIAAFLRYQVATAHHAMYVDEPWYAEAACNLVRHGRLEICEETWRGRSCSAFEKAPGWPVLMAPWVAVRGCASSAGIEINQAIGTLTPMLVAIAAALAGATWWQAAIAGLVIALHPVHVEWSVTGETNVAAAAAFLVGLCGALLYIRRGATAAAATAIFALALSTSIRPESFAPALTAAFVVGLAGVTRRWRRAAFVIEVAIVAGIATWSGSSLWAMNESTSGGLFFSAGNIAGSLVGLAGRIHAVAAAAAAGGAAMMLYRRRANAAALLAGTAVVGAGIVLAYDRFSDRMLLTAIVAAAPMVAFLFDCKRPRLGAAAALLAAGLLGGVWADNLKALTTPSATQLLETRIVAAVAAQRLAPDSLFITDQPTVLAAAGFARVMSTREALREPQLLTGLVRGGTAVFYLHDMYCEERFAGGRGPERCRRMVELFAITPVVVEKMDDRSYKLYSVTATPTTRARRGDPAA